MNSSTSSSKNEWKVVLVVLLAIAACELGVRALAGESANDRHHEEIPAIAAELNSSAAPRLLFLGNSLTRLGIRADSFTEELEKRNLRVGGMAKVTPDSSIVAQWYSLYDGYFSKEVTESPPNCVVVTFVNEYLSDQAPSRHRHSALVVRGPKQIWDVLRHDIHSFDEGADFVVACFSKSVAHQESIKDRLLAAAVPSYKEEKQRLNRLRRASVVTARKTGDEKFKYTYANLRRFMQLMRESGSHAVFCYIPIPGTPILDEQLPREIEQGSMTFIDFRALYERTQGHYPDNYHMDSFAADIYSRAVADALAERKLFESK
jgi:hypothetical protein